MKLAPAVLDGGAHGDELGHALTPVVAADRQAHADDAVGAELLGLLLHARHRELARLVHRLREHVHLLALFPLRLLVADVVDRAADDEPQRLKAGLADEQELVDRQVAGEQAGAVLLQAGRARLGHALGAGGVIGHVCRSFVRLAGAHRSETICSGAGGGRLGGESRGPRG